ncbi:MAG: TlpA disulfide reductase family protein [Spirochaetota bacterium]
MRSLLVISVLFLGVAFLATAGGAPETQSTNQAQETGPDAAVAEQLEAIGVQVIRREIKAESFDLPTLGGPTMSLADYSGRLVLLNFWATWCAPCVLEMPSMQTLYGTFRDRGLEVVAVNVQEDRDIVAAFVEEHGFSFPVLLDGNGRTTSNFAVRGLPTSYLIDREGNLIGMKVGFHLWDEPEVIDTFERLLEEGT